MVIDKNGEERTDTEGILKGMVKGECALCPIGGAAAMACHGQQNTLHGSKNTVWWDAQTKETSHVRGSQASCCQVWEMSSVATKASWMCSDRLFFKCFKQILKYLNSGVRWCNYESL